MTDRGRGMYGDAGAAARVLEAIGGPAATRPIVEPDPVYRGRCGNGAEPFRGGTEGCDNEAAPPPNPLGLCASCLARYRGRMGKVETERAAGKAPFVIVPAHACKPIDPDVLAELARRPDLILNLTPCGPLDEANVITCAERRAFIRCDCKRHPERPTRGHDGCEKCRTAGYVIVQRIPTNCGARFGLDSHGNRVRI